ncbi:MAG: glycosyltransferase [Sulfuritalea sp.]|nr:glycosyltransferase [Sulfuritalea sp.]
MAADVHCPATAAQGVRVTVGVASYNRPELLRRAIRSAVSQTYKNLEILISDNGSPNPEVRRVIEEFARSDTRIRCIFHPVNQGGLPALINFVRFDTDSIFYGLFPTATGKKLVELLRTWRVPKTMAAAYPFLEYNFVSYAFVFGLLSSGGFCNERSGKAIHYAGGREPFSNSPSVGWRHLGLFIAYVLIHLQMVARFIRATFAVGSGLGVVASPIAALYFFCRRMSMIVFQRLKRLRKDGHECKTKI